MVFNKEEFLAIVDGWRRAPYLHAGRTKSAGVDCINFIICVYEDLNVFEKGQIKYTPYPPDWHLHQQEERLLPIVEKYCFEISPAVLKYGDLILMKFGHCFSHGALYIENDEIIHAVARRGVIISNMQHRYWNNREKKYFRLLGQ